MTITKKDNIYLFCSATVLILSSLFFYEIVSGYPGVVNTKNSELTTDDNYLGKNITVLVLVYLMIITSGLFLGKFLNYKIDRIISLAVFILICALYTTRGNRNQVVTSLLALTSIMVGLSFKGLDTNIITTLLPVLGLSFSLAAYFVIENNENFSSQDSSSGQTHILVPPEDLARKLNSTEKGIIISIMVIYSVIICYNLFNSTKVFKKLSIKSLTKK